jgi:hypothetical protein
VASIHAAIAVGEKIVIAPTMIKTLTEAFDMLMSDVEKNEKKR